MNDIRITRAHPTTDIDYAATGCVVRAFCSLADTLLLSTSVGELYTHAESRLVTWEYGAALMAGQIQHHMVATQLIGSSALKLLHSTKAKHEHRLRRAQHVGVTKTADWTRWLSAQLHRNEVTVRVEEA